MVELGHVVFFVRDLANSSNFYSDLVGLSQKGITLGGKAAVFTGGRTHHELMLIEVGEADGPLIGRRLGLYHIGIKVGDTLEDLRHVKKRLDTAGYQLKGMADHTISFSLYLNDPDGNEVELYVDNPDFDWQTDNSWLENPVKPLVL